MIYLWLYWEFFKVGLFAIGGGLATIPFLQDIASRIGWFSADQIMDMLAVSECTPGAIGINMATYAGYQAAGVPGAACATLGVITPSIIVVVIVAGILKKFQDSKYVQALFYGLRPASSGLIASACIGVAAAALFGFSGTSVSAALADIFNAGGGAGKVLSELTAEAVTGTLLSHVSIKAVVLAVVLWVLMNLGKMERFKDNAVLKKLSTIHPVFFLAASAVVGIAFSFAE